MHPILRLAGSLLAATLVVGCAGAATTATSAAPADASTYWLRVSTTQALPPLNAFANGALLAITGDGILVTQGPMTAIYPGRLVPPLTGRPISDAGRVTIVGWARELGLLDGRTDFTDGPGVPGGISGRIELTLDGARVTLTGPTDAAGDPAPGTPAAYAELWRRLGELPTRLGDELGPEARYTPGSYAILVGPPLPPEPGLLQPVADWPLDMPIATFGGPVAGGAGRCGTVSGADAERLRPALEAANELTPWVQDPTTSATFGLTVRPLVPGEDPCRELFGGG